MFDRSRAWLHAVGVVTAEVQTDSGHSIDVRWTSRQEQRFQDLQGAQAG